MCPHKNSNCSNTSSNKNKCTKGCSTSPNNRNNISINTSSSRSNNANNNYINSSNDLSNKNSSVYVCVCVCACVCVCVCMCVHAYVRWSSAATSQLRSPASLAIAIEYSHPSLHRAFARFLRLNRYSWFLSVHRNVRLWGLVDLGVAYLGVVALASAPQIPYILAVAALSILAVVAMAIIAISYHCSFSWLLYCSSSARKFLPRASLLQPALSEPPPQPMRHNNLTKGYI